jgi:hypothetical protein
MALTTPLSKKKEVFFLSSDIYGFVTAPLAEEA